MEELEIKLKEAGKISRLTNKTFQFDKRLGEGFFAANYFLKARQIVGKNAPGHIVTMQFSKEEMMQSSAVLMKQLLYFIHLQFIRKN